jgi:hypothetical protein
MDARTDGSIANISATLGSANDVEVDFARYNANDALCCPQATTTVLYNVITKAPPRVALATATTRTNAG